MGPLIPLFWISGDVSSGFQSQGGFPCLCALPPVCNKVLKFTSGATPAGLLVESMAAKLFHPRTCTCLQASNVLTSRLIYVGFFYPQDGHTKGNRKKKRNGDGEKEQTYTYTKNRAVRLMATCRLSDQNPLLLLPSLLFNN